MPQTSDHTDADFNALFERLWRDGHYPSRIRCSQENYTCGSRRFCALQKAWCKANGVHHRDNGRTGKKGIVRGPYNVPKGVLKPALAAIDALAKPIKPAPKEKPYIGSTAWHVLEYRRSRWWRPLKRQAAKGFGQPHSTKRKPTPAASWPA